MENNEILTTAKNKSPPFRRRKINQQQDDKELLETLFNQTAFVQKNKSSFCFFPNFLILQIVYF